MYQCPPPTPFPRNFLSRQLLHCAGILLIVLVFALAKTPTWITGWGIIVLGILTILIGLTGLFTKPSKSYGLFCVHVSGPLFLLEPLGRKHPCLVLGLQKCSFQNCMEYQVLYGSLQQAPKSSRLSVSMQRSAPFEPKVFNALCALSTHAFDEYAVSPIHTRAL
jgi:hypothetical protein